MTDCNRSRIWCSAAPDTSNANVNRARVIASKPHLVTTPLKGAVITMKLLNGEVADLDMGIKADIIRIGNSQGVRIPKAVLEQCGLHGRVDMTVKAGKLIISPAREARAGWSDAFQRMAAERDDAPLFPDTVASEWDDSEWTW
jgi:antitoxin MazE